MSGWAYKKLLVTGLVLFGLALFCRPDSAWPEEGCIEPGPIILRIDLEISGTSLNSPEMIKTLKKMIPLREGERLCLEKLSASVDLLKKTGLFSAIHVKDPAFQASGVVLFFQLTPFSRIRDIKITGAFPLFEKEVLNAMTIFPGDEFSPDKLARQEANIVRLFENEGFLSPTAEVSSYPDKDRVNHVVRVKINRGDFYRIKGVEISGSRFFSDQRLKMRLETWRSSLFGGGVRRFIQKKFDQDMRNLIRFYRSKGYADVEIDSNIEKINRQNELVLWIIVREGPKYRIGFKGNHQFWDMTLKKDLALRAYGNRNDLGLKRSIRNIRKRYRKAGYPDVRVTKEELTIRTDKKRQRRINLIIKEGPRYIINSISLKGNRVFKDKAIKKQMITRTPGMIADGSWVRENLDDDKKAIRFLYLKKGYMNTEIREEIQWITDKEKGIKKAELSLIINEGRQTMTASVKFRGLHALSEKKALAALSLKPGQAFKKYGVKDDEIILSALISEKGYPHVKIRGKVEFTHDGTIARVVYDVDQGPLVAMGQVVFTGNFRTRPKIFNNELELEAGEPFSLKKMLETQRNIRNIRALDSAGFKMQGLSEKANEVHLVVEAEEKKPWYAQFGMGYDTGKEYYANTRLGDHNLFGLNKDAWVAAEISRIGYRGELGLTEPRFFGSGISANFNMFIEKKEEFNQDFGTRSSGATLGFNRRFLDYFQASLLYQFENREQYQTLSGPVDPEDEDHYDARSILVTTPSLIFNSTDSFIRPKKGAFSSLAVDISKGINNSLDDFLKYRAEARGYVTPLRYLTFAVRCRYGYIDPFGKSSLIPDDQLFFLGGTSDVRGFEENRLRFDASGDPVGGRISLLGSLEARLDLGHNIEFSTFYDTGSLKLTAGEEKSSAFRASAGIGLRYINAVCPIGLLYGWKLEPKEKESRGRFHFTLGYTF